MGCPDFDRLIDLYHGRRDPGVEDHLKTCPSCQADMEMLFLLPEAFALDVEVPEALIERVMASLPPVADEPRAGKVTVGRGLVSGLLGILTAVGGLAASGSVGAIPPVAFLLISLSMGAAATVLHLRLDTWTEPAQVKR